MNKKINWKFWGICYLISVFIIHYIEMFTVSGAVFLHKFELGNSFMLYCIAGIWNDKKLLVILCLGMYISVIVAYILTVVFISKRKYQFFIIPLMIFIVDSIFLVSLFWHDVWGVVGLIYKAIGCYIFFQAKKL